MRTIQNSRKPSTKQEPNKIVLIIQQVLLVLISLQTEKSCLWAADWTRISRLEKATLFYFFGLRLIFLNFGVANKPVIYSSWLLGKKIHLPAATTLTTKANKLLIFVCLTNEMQIAKTTIWTATCGRVSPVSWASLLVAALSTQTRR